MKEHVNFYENKAEAMMRIENTVVMYDDEPYYVLCVCDHKQDGILRVYLDHLGQEKGMTFRRTHVPYDWYDEPGMTKGQKMDEWLDKNPDQGVIRKMMNSPLFNKFRPFPLGMVNIIGNTVFVERQPTRHTQQGLTAQMLSQHPLLQFRDFSEPTTAPRVRVMVDFFHYSFYQTIKGVYPTPKECIDNLLNPKISNTAVGFSRLFAFVRGPMNMIFLAYKGDIVGYLPNDDFSVLRLDKRFAYTKELIDNLSLFNTIKI